MSGATRTEAMLSPRELAQVVGVSESSVKRWIDAGRLQAQRTSGGHRRVELLQALKDLRAAGHDLAPRGILGLSEADERCVHDAEQLGNRIYELLSAGRGTEAEATLLAALLSRAMEPAELFDGPVSAAMARIGALWTGGHDGIFVEHRASQILLRILDRIDALYAPPSDGLLAVGGSISGDAGVLPTRMAAAVLAAEGVYAVNLGADTPGPAFLDAAEQLGARLVWISVGYLTDAPRQRREIAALLARLAERGLECILGGRELGRLQLELGSKARIGRSMRDLATLAREMLARSDDSSRGRAVVTAAGG